jgi:ubiquinone/menaquinone biosynthesis C-methylase UbiE
MRKFVKKILRLFHLMHIADKLRFYLIKLKNRKSNQQFLKTNPDVILPPDYLMYESFQLDYSRYFINGRKTAEWLIDLVSPYINFADVHVLDWGCGPGRIIRHLPTLLPDAAKFYGTDYNFASIDWCRENLDGIEFGKNELHPPLEYSEASFNWIYGISIFTHLSKPAHKEWMDELFRVLKPGGILFLTLHGEVFKNKLDSDEIDRFNQNQLVVRGQVKEGHRTFIAFHPPEYVLRLTSNFRTLKHIPGKMSGKSLEQDVWIFQKN